MNTSMESSMIISKIHFCLPGEAILDLNQLWNTSTPVFNRCFQKTIPIWAPSLILLIIAPWQVYLTLCFKQRNPIRYNLFNISKFITIGLIVLVNSVQFGIDSWNLLGQGKCQHGGSTSRIISFADLTSSALNVFIFILFGFLVHLQRVYGRHSSGLAWFFTLLNSVLSVPSMYMLIGSFCSDFATFYRFEWNVSEFVLFLAHFTLCFTLFVLNCFADQRPNSSTVASGCSNKIFDSSSTSNPTITLSTIDSLKEDLKNGIHLGLINSTSLIKHNFVSTTKRSSSQSSQTQQHQQESPENGASFLSLRTYWWFHGLGYTGLKKTLTLDDLYRLKRSNMSRVIVQMFRKHWYAQLEGYPSTPRYKRASIIKVLLKSYGWQFAASTSLKLIHDVLIFALPQLLKIFISFISNPEEPTWHGYFISFMFFFISLVQSFLMNYYLHIMYTLGLKIRTGLTSIIYRKTLKLSNNARHVSNTGEIINLMSVDAQRISDLLPFMNLLWSAPFLIGLTMYFLWIELGPSVLSGVAALAILLLTDRWVSSCEKRYQAQQMKRKDERVQLISELVSGIQVVKLYGWERSFTERVNAIREEEIELLQKIAYIGAVTSFLWTSAPFLVSFVTFTTYILSSEENTLDAKKAFVSLALFNILKFPFTIIPQLFNIVVMARVSSKRLDHFMNAEEIQEYVCKDVNLHQDGLAIHIRNGVFSWGVQDQEDYRIPHGIPVLRGINLKVRKGVLIGICGYSGSGKSSLLSAILGEMERLGGEVLLGASETIAYISQNAWIRDGSMRENITFGFTYCKERYDQVVDSCALRSDIARLPCGDETEIGENGINLSGGQKQRVAIARACYSNASIILCDDPLSAVDSHIARHIFYRVFSNSSGYLKAQTRIVITQDISYLPEYDQIIVLENGCISESGTYNQLVQNGKKFAEYVRDNIDNRRNQLKYTTLEPPPDLINQSRCNSLDSVPSRKNSNLLKIKEKLFETEHTETGRVKLSVYANYFRLLTCLWLSMMLIGFIGMQIASVVSNIWLAIWSNDHREGVRNKYMISDLSKRNKRLTVYTIIGVTQGLFFVLGAVSMAKGTVNSSATLHRFLLERIIRSPMTFFDSTPIGRIVNRFSKDIDTIDSVIPNILRGLLICFLQVVSIFVLISTEVPGFMLIIFPILFVYYVIQKFYVTISRQLKRLESVTRSPIFTLFGETLSGASTIRAFGKSTQFISESDTLVDTNQQCSYPNFIANRWLQSRLELCGNLIVFFVTIYAVLSRDSSYETQPGFVALIITYALSITQTLNWFIRMSSEMENNVVSVERIGEYCENPLEPEWKRAENEDPKLPEDWPNKGEIEFVGYSVRYREGFNLVLNNISIRIGSEEKIGIVGRTGCGKSTLTLALFRILEANSGGIIIDGIDISQIGLHELRSKLSIIPQDPVLFSGTIRSNLDPFCVYSDDLLWETLSQCHLHEYISCQDCGLSFQVSEGGSNLSMGQRQLICLGRALLRKSKILVLDEATAAMDLETDALIQQTIRKQFAHCTVLTIAHRLHTILDSNRVLVLDRGRVAEFDSPANLLANNKSRFYELAKDERLI